MQPASQTANIYANAKFAVSATGTGQLSYQWRSNGVAMADDQFIIGAGSSNLLLCVVQTNYAANYSVLISDSTGSVTSAPAALVVGAIPVTLFNNWNEQSVQSGPTAPTTLSITNAIFISVISDYHFYNGGALPGTISLRRSDGTTYGPWQAEGGKQVWDVTNSVWVVTPNTNIPAGDYTVLDSGNATWSYNFDGGFSAVYGLPVNPPNLSITMLSGLPSVTIDGTVGTTYRVEYSTNLMTTNWIKLFDLTLPNRG